jgi:hypothetical protein
MVAIICIALFMAGFAWPPFWIGLTGYIIYIWSTAKQKRSDVIQSHLVKMVQGRRMQADVRNLYFEAAQAFAEDRGGRIFPEDRDTISCAVIISGQPYSVTFMRERRVGGTSIQIMDHISLDGSSVENLRRSEEALRTEMLKALQRQSDSI